jgi:hypothetical protein
LENALVLWMTKPHKKQILQVLGASCMQSSQFFASTLREQLVNKKMRTPLKNLRIYATHFHGNEADFLGFLQKLVPNRSLTLPFEPFRFWLRISGDIRNRKTTLRLGESVSR